MIKVTNLSLFFNGWAKTCHAVLQNHTIKLPVVSAVRRRYSAASCHSSSPGLASVLASGSPSAVARVCR